MTPTTSVPTFDDMQKGFTKERIRNNLKAYIGLCTFGGIFIVLAVTTKGIVSDVLSDFLVNIAAGLFSAAVLFALIQRIFFDAEKDNERTNALIRGGHQSNIMLDQALASEATVAKMVGQYISLLSRGKNKRPEAMLMYLNRAMVVLRKAADQLAVTKGYADIALNTTQHLWDEYYLELKKNHIAEAIEQRLETILHLTISLKNQEEDIKTFFKTTTETIGQVEKRIAAKEKPVEPQWSE